MGSPTPREEQSNLFFPKGFFFFWFVGAKKDTLRFDRIMKRMREREREREVFGGGGVFLGDKEFSQSKK